MIAMTNIVKYIELNIGIYSRLEIENGKRINSTEFASFESFLFIKIFHRIWKDKRTHMKNEKYYKTRFKTWENKYLNKQERNYVPKRR